MKTFPRTLRLDSQFNYVYRPLARNLILIVVGTLILAAGAVVYFDERLVHSMSGRLIEKSTRTNAERLNQLFGAAAGGLGIAQRQIEGLEIGAGEQQESLYAALEPFLAEFDFLDSINLADSSGSEYVLIKQSDEILTRYVDARTPDVGHWKRRSGGEVTEQWTRTIQVSPRDRPWYQGAMQRARGAQFWTDPYTFLTTKEPGISVSSRWPANRGDQEHVMAFNIALTQISRNTTRLRPSENGMTVIFTADGKTVGLPPDPRFADEKALLAAVLSPVSGLGVPALSAAVAKWEAGGGKAGIFAFRSEDRTPWWAGFSTIELGEGDAVWLTVLIPVEDFLGSAARLRNLSLAGIGIAGMLIAAMVLFMSLQSIRRQMNDAVERAGRRFGQYQLKHKIGEGGNGTVYHAQHALLRRPTAVKLMSPEFARSDAARERFEHEVQITSNLSHPNTIAIYDYGRCPDRTLYYAMELLNGSTLEHLVRYAGPLPEGRVIHILEQMAGSLAEAHEKGLIHRDIKPSNVMLCERGGLFDVVKVVDFGIVKEMWEDDADATRVDVLIGTPLYMAPELISKPGQASPQSDLYALGAVGYLLLTARNVFEGGSAVEICARHLNDTPIPPSQRAGLNLSPDLENIILDCLKKDPATRPAGAESLRASLLNCDAAGSWTQGHGRAWWHAHSEAFIGAGSQQESSALSNTDLLVDLDHRAPSSDARAG